jgi:5-methylcytosine-specific restriction enzyme subunit McrC
MRILSCREYETVERGDPRLSAAQFDELVRFALTDDGAKVMEPHRAAVRMLNHVGVIKLRSGLLVEILPKVQTAGTAYAASADQRESARALLIDLLRALSGFSEYRVFASAPLRSARYPLFEIFIRMFLDEVDGVVVRGVRRDYVSRDEELAVLRGKLRVTEQIRQEVIAPHRFAVRYDEYFEDTAENRLLKGALEITGRLTRSADSHRRIQQLLFLFEEVNRPVDHEGMWARLAIHRANDYYIQALRWAMLFLRRRRITSTAGADLAFSLLFPMEKLFERYVFEHLRRNPALNDVRASSSRHHLAEEQGHPIFQIIPDITAESYDGTVRFIFDAKWKRLDEAARDQRYLISQADMYQLLSYAAVYHAGEARRSVRLYLVYPKSETFTEPRHFRFSTEPVFRITAVPFDLAGALDGTYGFRVDTAVSALDLEGTVQWKGSLDEMRQLR